MGPVGQRRKARMWGDARDAEEEGGAGRCAARVERPRREGAREQARLGRVLGREGELGPERRFGLGLGFWVFGLVWVFCFLLLFNISNSYLNSTKTN